jgi:hypothetical protein
MLSIVEGEHVLLIYGVKKIGHQIYFSDKDNFNKFFVRLHGDKNI